MKKTFSPSPKEREPAHIKIQRAEMERLEAQKVLHELKNNDTFPEVPFGIEKTVLFNGQKWSPASAADLQDIRIGEIASGAVRLMVKINLGSSEIYFVGNDDDFMLLRAKYPDAKILNIKQILALFEGALTPLKIEKAMMHVTKLMPAVPRGTIFYELKIMDTMQKV